MRCANSECGRNAQHLFEGTLWLVELDVPPGARIVGDESGFPICVVPSRYFWLCPDCSRSMKVHGWTSKEIIVRPISLKKEPHPAQVDSAGNFTSRAQCCQGGSFGKPA